MRKCVAAVLVGVLCLACTDKDKYGKCNETPSTPPAGTGVEQEAPVSQPATTAPSKIKIGHDTTRITGPLKADGTPDYIAALNEQYGKGVTPQNNAMLLILQAIGPENVIDKKVRAATLKAMGYEPPDEPAYFASYRGLHDPAYGAVLKGPWQRADHPAIAKWLDENKAPLDLLVAASKRSRYYMPIVAASQDGGLLDAFMLPSMRKYLIAVERLIARVNLAAGEGRIEQGWQDILAVHRLGVLLGQDATLVGHLVGLAAGKVASGATIDLATSGKLTAAQARAILADMKALGPLPSVVTAVDHAERYLALDMIVRFRNKPTKIGMLRDEPDVNAVLRQVDFNVILGRANAHYDDIVAAMRKDSFAERHKAYVAIKAGLDKFAERIKDPAADKPPVGESLPTRRVGNLLLAILMPTLSRAKEIADAASVRRDVATVAVALAAYRAEQGSYPGQLSALAPKYLQAVPDDFCGGKPFIYRRVGKGYLLYSVGENMRDDGGVDQDPDKDDIAARAQR